MRQKIVVTFTDGSSTTSYIEPESLETMITGWKCITEDGAIVQLQRYDVRSIVISEEE